MQNAHDVLREVIDLYVDKSRLERMIYLWEKPKRRAQLLDELLHCMPWFREECSTRLTPALEDPQLVAKRMRQLGAGATCFAFGGSEFDGQEVDLDLALADAVGRGTEVLLYCRACQVAFVEEHDGYQMLLHPHPPRRPART